MIILEAKATVQSLKPTDAVRAIIEAIMLAEKDMYEKGLDRSKSVHMLGNTIVELHVYVDNKEKRKWL